MVLNKTFEFIGQLLQQLLRYEMLPIEKLCFGMPCEDCLHGKDLRWLQNENIKCLSLCYKKNLYTLIAAFDS